MIGHTVKEITGVSLERKKVAYLLHDTPLSNKRYKNSLLGYLLTAAKTCISALWKSPVVPTKDKWMAIIKKNPGNGRPYDDNERTGREIWENLSSILIV